MQTKRTAAEKEHFEAMLWHHEIRIYQEREDARSHAATLPKSEADFVLWQAGSDFKRALEALAMVRTGTMTFRAFIAGYVY